VRERQKEVALTGRIKKHAKKLQLRCVQVMIAVRQAPQRSRALWGMMLIADLKR